jgi:hypothetical protein
LARFGFDQERSHPGHVLWRCSTGEASVFSVSLHLADDSFFYLSYMAGLSMQELRAIGGIAPRAHRRRVVQAEAFAIGVITIFVLLGLGATA